MNEIHDIKKGYEEEYKTLHAEISKEFKNCFHHIPGQYHEPKTQKHW